jgi:hypothetical protein
VTTFRLDYRPSLPLFRAASRSACSRSSRTRRTRSCRIRTSSASLASLATRAGSGRAALRSALFMRESRSLLSHATVLLLPSGPLHLELLLSLNVGPPQHAEQAELRGENKDEGKPEQPLDGGCKGKTRQRPLPAGHVLVLGGGVEKHRERYEPDEHEHQYAKLEWGGPMRLGRADQIGDPASVRAR